LSPHPFGTATKTCPSPTRRMPSGASATGDSLPGATTAPAFCRSCGLHAEVRPTKTAVAPSVRNSRSPTDVLQRGLLGCPGSRLRDNRTTQSAPGRPETHQSASGGGPHSSDRIREPGPIALHR
jgi:hypothetical protein